ncbi:thioredoxin domain-containing protein [Candidatus Saccharibacteria bacterium]|nr:thioredoxin domain-containing protein [Candidatus Saccharibacteria bacterium]
MDKRFLGILGIIAAIFIGIFVISQHSSNGSSGSNGSSSGKATNHVMGENQKNVVVMEYGDYECPICGAYYLPLKQAVDQNIKDIKFQFRNLPLSAIHQNAFAGARAAEAAGMQGKYWEMHDKLYENQSQWTSSTTPTDSFNTYAKQLGLDVNKFKTDYISSSVNDSINADITEFGKTGQDKATPTIFINGVYVPNSTFTDPQTGAPTTERINSAIQAAIKKSSNN